MYWLVRLGSIENRMDNQANIWLQAKEKVTDPKSKESENVSIARQDSTMMMNQALSELSEKQKSVNYIF